MFAVCSQVTIAAPKYTLERPPANPTRADLLHMGIRISNWIHLGQCEQPSGRGGDGLASVDWKQTGNYIGGLGFYSGTYRAYKPKAYPWPPYASPYQLMITAERVRVAVGIHAWGCAAAWR